jgi:hypothetical protein
VLVTLRDGSRKRSFPFEPDRQNWNRKKPPGEFLIGHHTGLSEPFAKVFVKRIRGTPATAHNLLRQLEGQTVVGTLKVLGYARDRQDHIYFFQNLPASYKLLSDRLTDIHIIRSEIVRAVVNQSAELFENIFQRGYVYIDFCAKNIMLDYANKRIAVIDLDSSWSTTSLSKVLRPSGHMRQL